MAAAPAMALHTDVCVVGGGPAGLSAAHALLAARPSLRVAVFERAELRPRGAVVMLVPNGVRAVEAIRPALKPALQRHHNVHMKTRSFSAAGELVSSSDDGGPLGKAAAADGADRILLHWHALQQTLADALPPGVLHTSHAFQGYSESEEGVVAEFEAPGGRRSVHAALLVGCDGGQSRVREQLLADGPPQFLGMAVWRGVRPRPADWPVDHGYVGWWGAPGGPGCMSHTLEGGTRLAWQAFAPWPADQLGAIGGKRRSYYGREQAEQQGREQLGRALAAFGAFPDALRSAMAGTDPASVTEHGQFCREVDQCQTYARGRVALVGDAAHLATPFLGQGCSQAIEDALELGRAVGVHGPTPAALAAYQEVRLPLSSAVQRASVQFYKNYVSGVKNKSEFELNAELGFSTRTFEPLAPAQVVAAV